MSRMRIGGKDMPDVDVFETVIEHFPDIIDVAFTADMESQLDRIEEGQADWVGILREFYGPFAKSVDAADEKMEKVSVKPQETDEVCEECGKPMLLRVGRRGPFLACSGNRKNCRQPSTTATGAGLPWQQLSLISGGFMSSFWSMTIWFLS